MNDWKDSPITRRADGSYVIAYAGFPEYHVPNEGEWTGLWAEVDACAAGHPDQVTDEPAPPEPTQEELLERAKTIKTAEFDRVMADTDAQLVRSTTDLVAATLAPATLAEGADTDNTGVPTAEELEQSRAVFTRLRAVQAQNRALRAEVMAAETVEAVEAITPITTAKV